MISELFTFITSVDTSHSLQPVFTIFYHQTILTVSVARVKMVPDSVKCEIFLFMLLVAAHRQHTNQPSIKIIL